MNDFDPQPQPDEERLSRLSGGSQRNPDDVIREYESRYNPDPKPKRKMKPRSYSTMRMTDEEKLWSAVAHSSMWFTFLLALPTSGVSLPFVVFVPLIVYLLFRKKSDYIAFHALQAFVLQLLCTVGVMAGFVVTSIVWTIGLVIASLLVVVLVGVVLLPLWAIAGALVFVALGLAPLAGLVLATVAAVRVYTGTDFRYPYIADWVDRQLAGGLLNS